MRLSTTTLSTISVCAITLSTLPALAVPVQDVHAHQHISDLWKRASSVVTRSVMTTKSKSYDYIIVGGGLAGLTVAGRLSEDPNVSVLVLETGDDDRTDSRITDVGNYGQAFGTNLDWAFKTVGSSAYGAKTIRGGKTLGGSTSINGAAWTRGSAAQYDAIGQLGNDGWSWDDLLRYMNKAESFTKPNSDQAAAGAKFVEGAHGYGGPIQTEFTPVNTNSKRDAAALDKRMYTGPQQPAFESAFMTALGLQSLDDLAAGEANGVAYTINNIAQDGTRSSSAAGYITPVEYTRPNLRVLVSWRGSQLLWDANSATPRATGVRVQRAQGGNTYDLTANKEVIIAAGAINSPAFLERSGVGSAKVLKAARVAHKVDLPSVGANLVEQTMDTLGAPTSVDFGGRGPSNLIAMPNINQIMTNGSATRTWIESNYQTWANEAVQAGAAVSTDALIAQWKLQTTAIFEHKAPVVEMFADSGFPNGGLGIDTWQLLPYSRGHVHISSSDAFILPTIDPRYFSAPIDLNIQIQSLRSGRKAFKTDPLASLTNGGESVPGFKTVPDNKNQGAWNGWRNWIMKGFSSVAHPVGTCAMASKELGGCVDAQFKVYGTDNVRVVDASVLPFQVSAHLSSTLYGVAEKAAETIKMANNA